jgi:aldehyde:ferredoxin oxidoreductase
MNNGITGRILRVNLSNRSFKEKDLSVKYLLPYIGGDGLGAKILYDEVPPGVGPLDPENRFFYNNLGLCWFGAIGTPLDLLIQALNSAVGEKFSIEEVKKVSFRCANLRRAFNLRHGLTPEDDTLSPRLLEPPPDGPSMGSIVQIKPMVRDYYQRMGWDEKTGKPLISTLRSL